MDIRWKSDQMYPQINIRISKEDYASGPENDEYRSGQSWTYDQTNSHESKQPSSDDHEMWSKDFDEVEER